MDLISSHKRMDGKQHTDQNGRDACCYEICQSEELGRYLIASRDISPLEIVIMETPLVCAPADDPNFEGLGRIPMCLGCFARISTNSPTFCSQCNWPVCDSQCELISHHADNECAYFKDHKVPFKTLPYQHLLNESIFILRCILLKMRNPEVWTNIVLKFEHHTDVRQGKPDCVEKDRKIIANLKEIQDLSGEWFPLREDEVIHISGILNVNAFSSTKLEDECRSRRVRRRVTICQCLYPTATLIAHQCIPNACWTISSSPRFEQTIRTTVPIKKGEMICIAYAPQEIMWPTLQRLISTSDIAHFICRCHRCQDPTEARSYIGALKCSECSSRQRLCGIEGDGNNLGYLLPENPTEPESKWVCQNPVCDSTKSVVEAVRIVHIIEQKFLRIKNSAFNTQREMEELEELYEDALEKKLHKNHYLLQEISLRIVNKNALSIYCLDLDDLERFLFHCNSILDLTSILSPGYCRPRALVQFYASQAMMVRARKLTKNLGENLKKERALEIYSPIYSLQKESFMFFRAEDENENRYKTLKGFNQYVACLVEEMDECRKKMQINVE